ncbi:MAG: radical SAM protein [Spirochaetia bacterium]|nr:radical SAM protein [Spirochaetia bacterium]
MLDSFGRNIHYLRISVTDRCNLRCIYCMPEEGIELVPHNAILSFEQIEAIARTAVRIGIDKIRLTGGEPLVRKGIVDLVARLRKIPGLKTLAMTTNGTLLAPLAGPLFSAGLGSVNISLDTLNPERYARLTRRGRIEDVLAGIDAALAAGLAVKINTVVMDDTSHAEIEALKAFARQKNAAFQTIAQYSLQSMKMDDHAFDRPPPCATCNRIRLLADGTLRACLQSDIAIPVDFQDIEGSIKKIIELKPAHGTISATSSVGKIGG